MEAQKAQLQTGGEHTSTDRVEMPKGPSEIEMQLSLRGIVLALGCILSFYFIDMLIAGGALLSTYLLGLSGTSIKTMVITRGGIEGLGLIFRGVVLYGIIRYATMRRPTRPTATLPIVICCLGIVGLASGIALSIFASFIAHQLFPAKTLAMWSRAQIFFSIILQICNALLLIVFFLYAVKRWSVTARHTRKQQAQDRTARQET